MTPASPLTRLSSKSSPKAAPFVLESIRVASPCPASWEKMTGDDRVRHCQECKLNVYNLSEMTRIEAERLIADREGRLCVRFYRRADGTILTQDCPRGLQAVIRRVSRLAGTALSAMLSLGTAFAQTPTKPSTQTQGEQTAENKAQLSLTVVDPAGAVISNAKILLVSKDRKTRLTSITGPDGSAFVSGLAPGSFVLTIEHAGFHPYTKKMVIKKAMMEIRRIKLAVSEVMVGVLVEASAPLIDYDSATIQTTFSGDLIRSLPRR